MTAEKDVMERAVEGRSVHHRRRLIFVFALLAAALVPLAAIGAANDWWFLKNGSAPAPTSAPQVVKEGKWDGQPWQLMAYPSASNGLCFSITPKGSGATGEGGAASCGPFVGFESGASPEPITALVGGGSAKLPAYIAGLVIDEASVVEVRFPDGNVMRVATFAGLEPLQHVRFYAAQLPASITPSNVTRAFPPTWVAGLDASGTVVACLTPRIADVSISTLSDCT